jgi:TRAP-type C4-dicarboxylate transport system substrate-binding protein
MIPSVLFVSKRWMAKLPKDLQSTVVKTGRDAEAFAGKFAANANKNAEALWKKNGAEVIRLSAADQAEVTKRLAPLGDEFLGGNPKTSKMYGILKNVLKTASADAPK